VDIRESRYYFRFPILFLRARRWVLIRFRPDISSWLGSWTRSPQSPGSPSVSKPIATWWRRSSSPIPYRDRRAACKLDRGSELGNVNIHAHILILYAIHAHTQAHTQTAYHKGDRFRKPWKLYRVSLLDTMTDIRADISKTKSTNLVSRLLTRASVTYHDDDIVADISAYRSISWRATISPEIIKNL